MPDSRISNHLQTRGVQKLEKINGAMRQPLFMNIADTLSNIMERQSLSPEIPDSKFSVWDACLKYSTSMRPGGLFFPYFLNGVGGSGSGSGSCSSSSSSSISSSSSSISRDEYRVWREQCFILIGH